MNDERVQKSISITLNNLTWLTSQMREGESFSDMLNRIIEALHPIQNRTESGGEQVVGREGKQKSLEE